MVLSDEQLGRLRLLQLESGKILFEIPAVPRDTKLHLHQGDLIIEEMGKGLSVWDLGRGSPPLAIGRPGCLGSEFQPRHRICD